MKLKSKLITSVLALTTLATTVPLASCATKTENKNNIESENNLAATGYCKVNFALTQEQQAQGAKIVGTKTVQVKKNKMFGTVKQPIATKTGAAFKCWLNSKSEPLTPNTTITSDMTLTPDFENSFATITWDAAGGLWDGQTSIKTTEVEISTKATVPVAPVRDGYKFIKWVDANGKEPSEVTITEATTFTAVWELIPIVYHTVTFDSNGGTSVDSQTIVDGQKATEPQTTRTGYTFLGWYNGSTKFDFSTPISSSLTLTAKWSINTFTINFDTVGGSSITSKTVDYGTTWSSIKSSVATPVKEDFKFDGWKVKGSSITDSYIFNENTTLVASWTEIPVQTNLMGVFANEASTLSYTNYGTNAPDIKYSKDGQSWTILSAGSTISISANDHIYLKGNNPSGFSKSWDDYTRFSISGAVDLKGSIMALIDDGANTTRTLPSDNCFWQCFYQCQGIRNISENFLPATTLANNCYYQMFMQCYKLISAPNLPANSINKYAYAGMFQDCISLVHPPIINSGAQLSSVYTYGMYCMFYGAKRLMMRSGTYDGYVRFLYTPYSCGSEALTNIFYGTFFNDTGLTGSSASTSTPYCEYNP